MSTLDKFKELAEGLHFNNLKYEVNDFEVQASEILDELFCEVELQGIDKYNFIKKVIETRYEINNNNIWDNKTYALIHLVKSVFYFLELFEDKKASIEIRLKYDDIIKDLFLSTKRKSKKSRKEIAGSKTKIKAIKFKKAKIEISEELQKSYDDFSKKMVGLNMHLALNKDLTFDFENKEEVNALKFIFMICQNNNIDHMDIYKHFVRNAKQMYEKNIFKIYNKSLVKFSSYVNYKLLVDNVIVKTKQTNQT